MQPIVGEAGDNGMVSVVRRRCWHLLLAAVTMLPLALASGADAAPAPAHSRVHVYLLRGVFDLSLGIDEIAAKLRRQGVEVTVQNYLAWPALAEEAAADYKSGRVRTIILVGHSAGAAAVTAMAARLGELGVPVKLAVGLDPVLQTTASGHVTHYLNYYIGNGAGQPVRKGRHFTGQLRNVDVEKMPGIGHFNIDKNQTLQRRVIGEVRAAL